MHGVLAASPVYILSILFSLSLSFIIYCVISNILVFLFFYIKILFNYETNKTIIDLPWFSCMKTVIKFHAGPLACSMVIYSCLPRLKYIQASRTFFSSSSWIPLPIKKTLNLCDFYTPRNEFYTFQLLPSEWVHPLRERREFNSITPYAHPSKQFN